MQRKWKRRWQRLAKAVIVPATAGLLLLSAYSTAWANPTNGSVTSGNATITSNGNTTTINQSSSKAVINWTSFSIASGETVNFVQPSANAVALNRVTGNSASEIYGRLNANGKVYLVNPNGILFAKGAQVNVGGLVASTLAVKDSDFLSGNYVFSGNGTGSVVNQGTITANNEAVFIGTKVANEGVVAAKVAGLAAGKQVRLDFSGDSLLNVNVDTGVAGGSAVNSGTITANGGLVVMSAGTKDALLSTVVNNSGLIKAQSVDNVNGVIRLAGSTVTNAGTLDASGKAAGQTGGTVKVLGDSVSLKTGSTIDVSGDAGGGTVLIGGAYQGGSSEYAAKTATVQNGATIKADAITTGNGGQVVVWSNDTTNFDGSITAKGGSVNGKGGSVETSGKKHLSIGDAAKVDTTAANGSIGSWLLDPSDFTVAASGGDMTGTQLTTALGLSDVTITTSSSGNSTAKDGSGNTLYTGAAGTDGNININDAVSWNSHKLTLTAVKDVNINAVMTAKDTASLDLEPGSGNVNCGLNSGGFTGRVDFFLADGVNPRAGTGFLRINNNNYNVINSMTGLQGIQGNQGGRYALGTNLDASTFGTFQSMTYFTGVFDGLGHTVSGLNPIYGGDGGFFIQLHGTVRNLGLVNASVAPISNSYNVYGGILAADNSGHISNCYTTGSVMNNNPYYGGHLGGLVGINESSGSITNSYSTCNVTVNNSSNNGNNQLGGLVGWNYGTISRCYTFGGQVADSTSNDVGYMMSMLGGLVGANDGSIVDCFSFDKVNPANTGTKYVGGLVGCLYDGSISTSYSAGPVGASSGGAVGGLVGYTYSGSSINNCYWDVNTAGQGTGSGSGLSTSNMKTQANYTPSGTGAGQWNFTNIWGINPAYNDGYPYFIASMPPGPIPKATFSGTLFNSSGVAYGAGYTITAVDNGVLLGTTTTDSSGFYSFSLPFSSVGIGTSFLDYVAGSSVKASLVFISGGVSASNLNLTENKVTVDGNGWTLTNTHLSNAIGGAQTSPDILYTASGNNITFNADVLIKNAAAVSINGALTAGSNTITIENNSSVTQTSAGIITTSALELAGTGSFALNNANNAVGTLKGGSSTEKLGTLTFRNDNSFAIDGLMSSGVITLTSNNAVTQTNPITAAGLTLLGAGSYTLDNAGNAVGTVSAGTSAVKLANLAVSNVKNLTVSGIYANGAVSLKSTGSTGNNTVMQTGAIVAGSLELLGSGNFTLSNAGNAVGSLAGGSSSEPIGTLTFTNNGSFVLDSLTSSGLITLTSNGSVTQTSSGSITTSGLTLLGTGSYTLDNAGNAIGTLSAGTGVAPIGSLVVTNAQNLTVSGIYSNGAATFTLPSAAILTLSGNVSTTGTQTYNSPVIINKSGTTTISSSGGNIVFNGTLDGTAGKSAAVLEAASGNITLGATGTTTALDSLTLKAGGSISAPYATKVGRFILNGGTWSQIGSSLPTFTVTDFTLNGGTFIRAINSDTTAIGTSANPYRITDIYGLQGIGSSGMLSAYSTLANSIDASGSNSWNSGAGFVPIGNAATNFSGTFNGNNYIISNLSIKSSAAYVGLFGVSSGTIQNVRLTDISVTGTNSTSSVTGGLVGWNNGGTIRGAYDSGTVGLNGVSGLGIAGGLVGASSGTIADSYSSCQVENTGSLNLAAIGGLVGANGGTIRHSYSSGQVSGSVASAGLGGIGGLVGANGGIIEEAYSTSQVTGSGSSEALGGLVGVNGGNTTATSISSYVGSLIGNSYDGRISNSYSNGQVTGSSGSGFVGGLVGLNDGSGATATIEYSYSTGNVTGSSSGYLCGGLVGGRYNTAGSDVVTASYWDVDTSHTTVGVGYGSASGVAGLTSDNTAGYASAFAKDSYSGWNIADTGGSSAIWRLYGGQTYPLLRYFLTPLTVEATGNPTKGYDGNVYSGSPSGVTYTNMTTGTSANAAPVEVYGTLSYGSNANAGTYTLTGLYSNQQGYDINYGTASTLIITPQEVTVTTSAVTKPYDGGITANGSLVLLSGTLYNGDTLSGGSYEFADANAGTGKTVKVSGIGLTNSANISNYTITCVDNTTSTINPEPLTVSTSAVTKPYDGTPTANGSLVLLSGTLYNGDTLSGGSYAFADANAGTGKTVTVNGIRLTNSINSGNYTITCVDNTTSTINPEPLTVSTSAVTKPYDGTPTANGSLVLLSGTLYNGDTLSGGSYAFADANAGTGKTVTVNGIRLTNSINSGNYTITCVDNTTSTINPEPLTVSTSAVTKPYDGRITANGSPVVLSGMLYNGDTLSGGSYAFTDANAGTGKTVKVSGIGLTNSANISNYTITCVDNTTSTINPEPLTVSTSAVTKPYDGTPTANGSLVLLSGTLYNGDTLSGGSYAFADANAGTGKTVTVNGIRLTNSINSGNYTITCVDNTTSTINPEPLTVTTSAVTKTYNGTPTANGSLVLLSGTLYNGDTLSGGSYAFADANAGTGKTVKVSGIGLANSANSSNYTITCVDNTTSIINPEPLTVSTSAVTKPYDGTITANGSAVVLSGTLYNGDTLSGGSYAFADVNAGTGKTVTVHGVTLTNSSNYNVTYVENTASTITPAALTITANNVSKQQDGQPYTGSNSVTYSGFVNGETSAVLSGMLSYGGDWQTAVEPGTYSIVPGGVSAANYLINFRNGTLTIRNQSNDANYTSAVGNAVGYWRQPDYSKNEGNNRLFLTVVQPGVNTKDYNFLIKGFSEYSENLPNIVLE